MEWEFPFEYHYAMYCCLFTVTLIQGTFYPALLPFGLLFLFVKHWTDKFVLIRTDEAAKPFILQEEDIPDVVALGDGTEYEQLHKEHLYGIDWTGNVGYGYWQFACLMTHTTA